MCETLGDGLGRASSAQQRHANAVGGESRSIIAE